MQKKQIKSQSVAQSVRRVSRRRTQLDVSNISFEIQIAEVYFENQRRSATLLKIVLLKAQTMFRLVSTY